MVAIASASSTLRERESHVDQDPLTGLGGLAALIEQADVDVALDAGDVHPGQAVRAVDDLDYLSRYCQAHVAVAASLWYRVVYQIRNDPFQGADPH